MGYLGVMLCIIGFMLLMPLVLLPFHMDEIAYAHCFYAPGLAAVVLGWLGWETIHARPKAPLAPGQDATVIVLTWMLAMTVGALPFLLTGSCRTFTQAVFETMSGLSTTTFTVLDVERCPQLILLYRSALLFFGGIGLVLIMVSAISDAHGLRIYTQEGHANRLLPNLRRSALLVVRTYVLLIGVGTVLLTLCGMAPFDALNHAVGAVATGGFSTRNASVAAWDSPAIEVVLAILMLLGGTNSATLVALLGGRWRTWWRDAETRAYLGCAAACTLGLRHRQPARGPARVLLPGGLRRDDHGLPDRLLLPRLARLRPPRPDHGHGVRRRERIDWRRHQAGAGRRALPQRLVGGAPPRGEPRRGALRPHVAARTARRRE